MTIVKFLNATDIDSVLPQTQCGLCGHGGCAPYAKAIATQNEAINLCPPGGVPILKKLAELTAQDATPYIEEMARKAKPTQLAVIREAECIGCTKCIQACPVDAIIGAAKQMHTIIADACTGCELCIPPCPTDCIELVTIPTPEPDEQLRRANVARQRYHLHQERITKDKSVQKNTIEDSINARKMAIAAAVARVKARKSTV